MRKHLRLLMIGIMTLILLSWSIGPVMAAERVILLTNSSQQEAFSTNGVEKSMKEAFTDWEVQTLYSVEAGDMERNLTLLAERGVREVVIQPLSVTKDELYEQSQAAVIKAISEEKFAKIVLGRPLLNRGGENVKTDDYLTTIFLIESEFPRLQCCNAVVLVGRGGNNPKDPAFRDLQNRIDAAGFGNIYACALEGEPTLSEVVGRLAKKHLKKVTLVPFTFAVAKQGTHISLGETEMNQVAGVVRKAGFKVETELQGLGERFNIQQLFVQHTKDAINNSLTTAITKPALSIQSITAAAAIKKWRDEKVVIIDVRTPEEFATEHIKDAVSIPISELAARSKEIDKNRCALLICSSGKRSGIANLLLQQMDYNNTVSVIGGLEEWKSSIF